MRGEPDAGHRFKRCPGEHCDLHGVIPQNSCHEAVPVGWCGYPDETHGANAADDCECCGGPPDCGCIVEYMEGNDPETGPYGEWVCEIHRGGR